MPSPRRRRLDTMPRIRRQITAMFHDARAGEMDALDCYRLASVLMMAAKLIETGEIEERLAEIERRLADRPRIAA